jgi:hypothetical protein
VDQFIAERVVSEGRQLDPWGEASSWSCTGSTRRRRLSVRSSGLEFVVAGLPEGLVGSPVDLPTRSAIDDLDGSERFLAFDEVFGPSASV